jgi:Transposase DNA-binding/Transposase Tn5 dimerisation domain
MSWVNAELATIDLGDHRLNKRAIKIIENLGLAPGRTIPQTFQAWNDIKACYNFFSNALVSDEKLINPHITNTMARICEYPVVLLLSDTSELDYTSKEAMHGRERVTNTKQGLWLHPTIAVTPERLMLGIVEANFWSRESEIREDQKKYRSDQDKAPIENKESYRWLKSYRKSCEVARTLQDTHIISIMDREADIIDIFEEVDNQRQQGRYADFIVRSQHDRLIVEEGNESRKNRNKLREHLYNSPSRGEIKFTIPSTETRKGRKVKQQIKAIQATIKPANKKSCAKINAVMAIEETPPEGEEPLVWLLITSLPIETYDDAVKVINYYLCRWEIEMFFKVLKSGCKIEERQLQTTDRMKSLIIVFMILAWRVMFTMMLGRVCGEMPCDDVFDEAEWKSVYKILNRKKAIPKKAPSLKTFIEMVAMLGGYVPHKENPPGVKVMWKGMSRMVDFALAWEAFSE